MKLSLLRLAPWLLLLTHVACTSGSNSATSEETAAPPSLFVYRPMSTADIQRAAGSFGFTTGAPADSYTNGNCTVCHSKFSTVDGIEQLAGLSYRMGSCFEMDVTTPQGSQDFLACLTKIRGTSLNPETGEPVTSTAAYTVDDIKAALPNIRHADLGIYTAVMGHTEIAEAFRSAGLEDAYVAWKDEVLMPYGGPALPDQDATNLALWFRTGLTDFATYVKHSGPNVCQSSTETFIGSKVKEHVTRMSQEGEGWEFINVARGVPMFACTGTDKTSCFQQKNGAEDVFPVQAGWLNTGVAGTIRKLHSYTSETSFWIRSSADGRFIANGGSSAIVDLQPKLTGAAVRSVAVQADFDPSFTPDNQAFLFQGDQHGTRVCSQSILAQADLATLDFTNVGCSTSDLKVGLYQGIGSNLDTGDIRTINGGFKSDAGSELFQDTAPLFPAGSAITVTTIRRTDATAFEKASNFTVSTPYHANWMSSASNLMNVALVSAATNQKARHGGYRVILSSEIKEGSPLPAFDDASTAMLCTGSGEKPDFSFDERLMAYYAYGKHDAKVMPSQSSSDIFIVDLLGNGMPVQITKMPLGFYAQFPHFRSDGWLYFSVYDSTTGRRHVMATDAGIRLAQ